MEDIDHNPLDPSLIRGKYRYINDESYSYTIESLDKISHANYPYGGSNKEYLEFFTRYDPDAILVGVLLSGLLFGLAHGISKTYIYVAWLLGMYLSLIYLVSGDLMLVMLVHALFDITGFIHALYIHKPEKAKRKELR